MIWNKEKHDSERIDTLVAQDVVIKGDLEFSGGIQIDGRVIGSIKGLGDKSVVRITSKGHVEGNIYAPIIVINGRVTGSVYSHSLLELDADAHIDGDVHYQLMEMTMGAEINGRMVHEVLGVQEQKSEQELGDATRSQYVASESEDGSQLSAG
ncbi:MAG: polymer-forming cytoskeletal protein [Pseudomonadota bacterium]|nr:polymer-forming cytoskeletal protein [Pseudomonadota bacterium]